MKIRIKAKGKDSENNNDEFQNNDQLDDIQKIETEEELKAKEKQKQIDDLLEHFEKEAADSPELIKDKDSYFNSKEFDNLSNENFDFNKKRRAELEDRVVHLEDVYEQEQKKSKNTIPWRNYLVYLMIITSLSCCVTFSKYITEVSGGGSGTVAKFDVQLNLMNQNGTVAQAYTNTTVDYSSGGTVVRHFFKSKGESGSEWLQVVNNSDVTVKVTFNCSLVDGGAAIHPIKFFSDSAGTKEITYVNIAPGGRSNIYVFFYTAEKSATERIKIDMNVEQVD